MKTRNTDRTYDWNGHKGLPISFSHLTDEQMAGTVRMLMRHDLGHEGIVCGARDRIMCLVKEKAALEARLAELEADPARQTKMEGMPQDVIKLVIAARIVAYGDRGLDDITALDRAVEAFAERVEWENDPEALATMEASDAD